MVKYIQFNILPEVFVNAGVVVIEVPDVEVFTVLPESYDTYNFNMRQKVSNRAF